MLRSHSCARATWLFAACLGAPAGETLAASVTGVCPDGSVFVVSRSELIPCAGAKLATPEEIPPLRPEYLPRPYTWQVYGEGSNPNNAYNLLDAARQVRELRETGRLPGPATTGDGSGAHGAAPGAQPARPPQGPRDLGLTDGELRDLFFIVELAQEEAPAAFDKQTAAGDEILTVSLAYSPAFEARLAEAWRSRSAEFGAVLLFSAVARAAEPFYANFTFSQGSMTFQPRPDDPSQFGVLQGRLGPLEADDVVLGYMVLPAQIDVRQAMDVYWNDRRAEVLFAPGTD